MQFQSRYRLVPGSGPGLLLHQPDQGGEAGLQDHHPALHLCPAAHPERHPALRRRQAAAHRSEVTGNQTEMAALSQPMKHSWKP